jgi:ribosomal protein S18 acetylase RimI-like enzyme
MSGATSLRVATTDDLSIVTAWLTSDQETDLWSGGPVRFPIVLEDCLTAIGWDDFANWTLLDRGRVAGFGQIIGKPNARKHLARIIVDPAVRGHGLGRQLVAGLMTEARRDQARCFSLNVHPTNSRAIALYASLGFAPAADPDPGRTGLFTHMQCPAELSGP